MIRKHEGAAAGAARERTPHHGSGPTLRVVAGTTVPAGAAGLATGQPRFTDEAAAQLARQAGTVAAWHSLWARCGAARAAAGVTGDFAVGLHDGRGRGFMAVDRFAMRTLCWRVIDGQLHFAERADELAALPPRAELDPQALFDYLYFHVIPSPRTVWRDVWRLPPGHYGLFEGGRLRVAAYWVPHFEEPAHPRLDTLAGTFRTLLREAVAAQLDGSKPACFLSGGTDSSTVAGLAGEVSGRRAATFSIGFDAEGYDEMHYARIAAQHFGTEHHEHYVTPAELVRCIPEVAAHDDQPFGNSSVLPAYCCAKMAREAGATRLLAGDGGDELFGGNSRYARQRIFGWWDHLPGALRTGVLEPALMRGPLGRLPVARKGRSYVEQARVPQPERMQMYNLLMRLGTDQVFTPGFLARVDTAAPLRQQREVWHHVQGTGTLNRMLAFDWRYTLAEADLPKVRGSTALAGVSVGFPFLEQALVDFSLRLPAHYKLRGLKLRWFFKEALRDFLPPEIIAKKKQGFGLPFGVWATRHAGLRDFAADSLEGLAGRGLVEREFTRELMHRRLAEHPGYYGEMVWVLMMLEQWLRAHPGHAWA